MKTQLSKVYFDDKPVLLMGDEARPPVSRIVQAGGKRPDSVNVVVLKSPADMTGERVASEEIIDRTAEPTKPIYLRSEAKLANVVGAVDTVLVRKTDAPKLKSGLAPLPGANADRVIDQLGGKPPAEPADRQPGEFRGAVFENPAKAHEEPAVESDEAPIAARKENAGAAQAAAEAEAEERQEEERDQGNALQDEEEDVADAEEDEKNE